MKSITHAAPTAIPGTSSRSHKPNPTITRTKHTRSRRPKCAVAVAQAGNDDGRCHHGADEAERGTRIVADARRGGTADRGQQSPGQPRDHSGPCLPLGRRDEVRHRARRAQQRAEHHQANANGARHIVPSGGMVSPAPLAADEPHATACAHSRKATSSSVDIQAGPNRRPWISQMSRTEIRGHRQPVGRCTERVDVLRDPTDRGAIHVSVGPRRGRRIEQINDPNVRR